MIFARARCKRKMQLDAAQKESHFKRTLAKTISNLTIDVSNYFYHIVTNVKLRLVRWWALLCGQFVRPTSRIHRVTPNLCTFDAYIFSVSVNVCVHFDVENTFDNRCFHWVIDAVGNPEVGCIALHSIALQCIALHCCWYIQPKVGL